LSSVSSLEEASSELAAANAEGRRVRIGEDVTTDGLDRVLEHETGDLTCTVEAGLRLSRLNAELRRYGQRLSLDPPGDPTIGALLALNLSGPLRHRFGAPRDLVLGVTLVLADGTIASAGGKVVKNVAGYDLARLACGSRGRLGLIARASFRLHPLPKASRTLVVESEGTARAVAAILRSQLQPSALDILHPGRVALLFEGSPRAVEEQIGAARALLEPSGDQVAVSDNQTVLSESRTRQGTARGRVRFAPAEIAAVLEEVEEAVVRPAAGLAYVPHDVPDDRTEGARWLESEVLRAFDPRGVLAA
jgi:glycolate oxidase FAD binding subunit